MFGKSKTVLKITAAGSVFAIVAACAQPVTQQIQFCDLDIENLSPAVIAQIRNDPNYDSNLVIWFEQCPEVALAFADLATASIDPAPGVDGNSGGDNGSGDTGTGAPGGNGDDGDQSGDDDGSNGDGTGGAGTGGDGGNNGGDGDGTGNDGTGGDGGDNGGGDNDGGSGGFTPPGKGGALPNTNGNNTPGNGGTPPGRQDRG